VRRCFTVGEGMKEGRKEWMSELPVVCSRSTPFAVASAVHWPCSAPRQRSRVLWHGTACQV
jgi:hypothetical protein